MEWQPIETAPYDVVVLTYNKNTGLCIDMLDSDDGRWFGDTPIVWMPLPEAPKQD